MKLIIDAQLDDDDLDRAASALCDAALTWIIRPDPEVFEDFRFWNISEAGREIYRELAISTLETLEISA